MKFCWVTINTKKMDESLKFYRDAVGLPVARTMKPSPDMELAFLGAGETQVELIYDAKTGPASPGAGISLGFEVRSLEKAIDELRILGVPVHSGPFQPNPSIRFFYVLDPNGLKVQFVENVR